MMNLHCFKTNLCFLMMRGKDGIMRSREGEKENIVTSRVQKGTPPIPCGENIKERFSSHSIRSAGEGGCFNFKEE